VVLISKIRKFAFRSKGGENKILSNTRGSIMRRNFKILLYISLGFPYKKDFFFLFNEIRKVIMT